MKINVMRESLVQEIGSVGRAAARNGTLPILGNVLLQANDSGLRLAATNLEVAISTLVTASVTEGGGLTVPARLFGDIVKSLPGDDIELTATEDTLHIHAGGHQANLKGLPLDDFPMRSPDAVSPIAHVSGAHLKTAVASVSPAAATDEARPVLTGIRCVFARNALQLAATDGYRLTQAAIPADLFGQPITGLIPARSLVEVARIVRPGETVEIGTAHGQYVFRTGETVFYCTALTGDFPKVDAIVPTGSATTAVVDTAALRQAVDIAYLFARDGANILRLVVTEMELRIEAAGVDVGDNVNTVDALIAGKPLEIGVNAKYLLDALNGINTPQATLGFNTPVQPVMVTPAGDDTEFLAVIMPMALNQ